LKVEAKDIEAHLTASIAACSHADEQDVVNPSFRHGWLLSTVAHCVNDPAAWRRLKNELALQLADKNRDEQTPVL
jgi:hypothetical protein